jgi:hypothetical protein
MNFIDITKIAGIGTAIMLHETEMKKAIIAQGVAIKRVSELWGKLAITCAESDRLAKAASTAPNLERHNDSLKKALVVGDEILAALDDVGAATDRAHRAMPDFERWARYCI